MYRVSFVEHSKNGKLGGIPASYLQKETCPTACPWLNSGCYGDNAPLSFHWNKVNRGERTIPWGEYISEVKGIQTGALWRHGVVGDGPGNKTDLDRDALAQLAKANKGKEVLFFTHYPKSVHNLSVVSEMCSKGLTMNLSCDSLQEVDALIAQGVKTPMVVVLPSDTKEKVLRTPGGKKVVTCPATYREEVTCKTCRICAKSGEGRAVIGFPAHGAKKKTVDIFLKR